MSHVSERNSEPRRGVGMQDVALEKHYTVFEIAEIWNVSHMTVRRAFENEPGVLVFGSDETRWGRKRKTIRIPESVLVRVHRSGQQV